MRLISCPHFNSKLVFLVMTFTLVQSGIKRTQNAEGDTSNRIVGGQLVYINQYPYQVSIQNLAKHICGGAIISQTTILTAAHCTVGLSADFVTIRAGSTTRNSGGSIFRADRIVSHANFSSTTMDFDISYIKVKNLILFSTYMKAIPLAPENYIPEVGAKAVVTGWGLTQENGLTMPDSLRKVDLYLVDRDECNDVHEVEITNGMICAYVAGGDTCQGDSGGPLALGGTLIGVVSWGVGCARPGYPGVYTNVAFFRGWIKTMTGV